MMPILRHYWNANARFRQGVARQMAALSCGNVRNAILEAEAWRDERKVSTPAAVAVQSDLAALGF